MPDDADDIVYQYDAKRGEIYFECPYCGSYIWKDDYDTKQQNKALWKGMYCSNPNCGWPKQHDADEDEDDDWDDDDAWEDVMDD